MDDVRDDEVQIIEVINRNRIALWTRDWEAYESCFVHAGYTTRWNASKSLGNSVRQGWEDIAGRVRLLFADPRFTNPANAYETTIHDLELRIHGDMAWATFDQHYPSALEDIGLNLAGLTHEVRVFERHDGRWLIAFWGVMDPNVGNPGAATMHLSPEGVVTWKSPAAEALLKEDDDLVIRNGRLRVRDSRTDQKLQAAIQWAAARDTGLVTYRGALPVVHEAAEGLPTRVWWVLAESGLVVFTMADSQMSAHRLDAAVAVFGLSPAQKQLSGFIADGLSLPEIAEKMGITANTARTHLERIYEKVGVRTQPALVRVLLSTPRRHEGPRASPFWGTRTGPRLR
jgi:DNA-binding CsgD family transcriptional regulator